MRSKRDREFRHDFVIQVSLCGIVYCGQPVGNDVVANEIQ
jgi:hypothetical protein